MRCGRFFRTVTANGDPLLRLRRRAASDEIAIGRNSRSITTTLGLLCHAYTVTPGKGTHEPPVLTRSPSHVRKCSYMTVNVTDALAMSDSDYVRI